MKRKKEAHNSKKGTVEIKDSHSSIIQQMLFPVIISSGGQKKIMRKLIISEEILLISLNYIMIQLLLKLFIL